MEFSSPVSPAQQSPPQQAPRTSSRAASSDTPYSDLPNFSCVGRACSPPRRDAIPNQSPHFIILREVATCLYSSIDLTLDLLDVGVPGLDAVAMLYYDQPMLKFCDNGFWLCKENQRYEESGRI